MCLNRKTTPLYRYLNEGIGYLPGLKLTKHIVDVYNSQSKADNVISQEQGFTVFFQNSYFHITPELANQLECYPIPAPKEFTIFYHHHPERTDDDFIIRERLVPHSPHCVANEVIDIIKEIYRNCQQEMRDDMVKLGMDVLYENTLYELSPSIVNRLASTVAEDYQQYREVQAFEQLMRDRQHSREALAKLRKEMPSISEPHKEPYSDAISIELRPHIVAAYQRNAQTKREEMLTSGFDLSYRRTMYHITPEWLKCVLHNDCPHLVENTTPITQGTNMSTINVTSETQVTDQLRNQIIDVYKRSPKIVQESIMLNGFDVVRNSNVYTISAEVAAALIFPQKGHQEEVPKMCQECQGPVIKVIQVEQATQNNPIPPQRYEHIPSDLQDVIVNNYLNSHKMVQRKALALGVDTSYCGVHHFTEASVLWHLLHARGIVSINDQPKDLLGSNIDDPNRSRQRFTVSQEKLLDAHKSRGPQPLIISLRGAIMATYNSLSNEDKELVPHRGITVQRREKTISVSPYLFKLLTTDRLNQPYASRDSVEIMRIVNDWRDVPSFKVFVSANTEHLSLDEYCTMLDRILQNIDFYPTGWPRILGTDYRFEINDLKVTATVSVY